LTLSVRVYALVRAASAFLSTLVWRAPEAASRAPSRVSESKSATGGSRADEGVRPTLAEVPEAPRATLISGLRSAGVENRCPVCQVRFRGVRICSRCGADLEPLMLLAVKAWQLRQAARQALDAGDVEGALGFAVEAQAIQDTESGEALRLLGAWLKTACAFRPPNCPPTRLGGENSY
jgi:hypothetical protein